MLLPQAARTLPPAVVVYRAPDGSFRFPGDTGGLSTAKYDRLGYERIEARGWAEVRHLEGRLNARERSDLSRRLERQQAQREAGEAVRRSDLHHRMKTMSAFGRDLAREAMARTNARPTPRSDSGGLHVEVYSTNRSNRDPARADGHRRRD